MIQVEQRVEWWWEMDSLVEQTGAGWKTSLLCTVQYASASLEELGIRRA